MAYSTRYVLQEQAGVSSWSAVCNAVLGCTWLCEVNIWMSYLWGVHQTTQSMVFWRGLNWGCSAVHLLEITKDLRQANMSNQSNLSNQLLHRLSLTSMGKHYQYWKLYLVTINKNPNQNKKYWYSPTQLSHMLQCEALGGLNILQVKQYLSFIGWPFTSISMVLGGGLYTPCS